ncbi:MAG TPA: protein kinase [Thermoanaerobaculia bacterium]
MTLPTGTRLGIYEVLSPLGSGGMGEVYRARDSKLKRDVAIKVLPPSLSADPEALARFEREALAVAALSHPNILSIFDFGTHEGVSYAVMELLEGETLRGKLDAGSITQKQAVDYALQVAKGLSAAHEKGVIHRDLKPENLFVTRDGHLKILDFGLAKRVEAVAPGKETSAPTVSRHTEPGTVMGTVGYMSPEQVRGLAVDHRSDIFSFGAILYEMLSGKRAFSRPTSADTMAAIMKEEPPDLSESGRNTSPALDHIVKHCLEKDRHSRFQSARDLGFALSEASGPTSVPSGMQAVASSTGRSRILTAVAVIAVLAVAGIFLLRRSHEGPAEAGSVKRVAVLPFENLGSPEDDYFADGMADAIRGKLTSLPGVQVIARGSSTPYRKTAKNPRQIAQELEVGYLLTATVRWQKGSGGSSRVEVSPELVEVPASGAPTSKWQQPFDASLTDVFAVQSDIATQVARSLGAALGAGEASQLARTPTVNLDAYDAFLKGEETWNRGSTDVANIRKMLAFYERAAALDPGFVQAWARVSQSHSILYDNAAPTPEMAESAKRAAEKALALAPHRCEGHVALGYYRSHILGDHEGALEEYVKALRIAPGDAEILRLQAYAEEALGHWNIAVEHYKQAVTVDPRSPKIAASLGNALVCMRRTTEARTVLDRGLALTPGGLDLIHPKAVSFLIDGDLAGARSFLATASRSVDPGALVAYMAYVGDFTWALDDEQRGLLLRLPPDAFDNRGDWALALAVLYALKGDLANVRAHAEEARKAFEEQIRVAPENAQRHTSLGMALAYLGRKEEAIREGERGAALVPIAKDAQNGPGSQEFLARIYTLVGEPEKAIDKLEPLLKIPCWLSPAMLRIDHYYDSLRGNPRFQKLVARSK